MIEVEALQIQYGAGVARDDMMLKVLSFLSVYLVLKQ